MAAHDLLRHTVATLAYRGAKAVQGAPPTFAEFRGFATTRTPVEILAHIGDLLDWALSISRGKQVWRDSPPLAWHKEVERFFAALRALDDHLASAGTLQVTAEKLFQAPIADVLTHIGQIAMLRRMAGLPVKGENYFVAEIMVGRVGADQSAPRREFD